MTQVKLGVRNDDFVDLDIDQLAEMYCSLRSSVRTAQDQIIALKYEFHIRMRESGDANVLPSGKYEIKMTRRGARYNTDKLRANLEGQIDPMELALLIRPERTEVRTVPAVINGQKARSLKLKYQGKVGRIIDDARIDTPYLSVEEKEVLPERSAYRPVDFPIRRR